MFNTYKNIFAIYVSSLLDKGQTRLILRPPRYENDRIWPLAHIAKTFTVDYNPKEFLDIFNFVSSFIIFLIYVISS